MSDSDERVREDRIDVLLVQREQAVQDGDYEAAAMYREEIAALRRGLPAPYRPVPVSECRRVAEKFRKDRVLVVAYDAAFGKTHTSGWGRTPEDKLEAAALADRVGGLFGEPVTVHEDFRDAARLKAEFDAVLALPVVAAFERARARTALDRAAFARLVADTPRDPGTTWDGLLDRAAEAAQKGDADAPA